MRAYGIRQFLAWLAESGCPALEALGPAELSDFVVAEAARLHPRTMHTTVPALRAFVRFLFATGVTPRDLSGAVPSVPSARDDGLPKGVSAGVVAAMLGSCDRGRRTGRRDYTILILMSRLGLRAIEVSRMQLEDIDWRAGELDVRGKGGRADRLPLPCDVGESIVEYLRFGRQSTEDRSVFLGARGSSAMSRNAVVLVARTACERAGIPRVGGHRLRHTAATQMLGHGASLREVGQILRHSDDTVTAIYAKVDQASLALVVRPWPQVGAR